MYQLSRKYDSDTEYQTLYTGPDAEYTDTVPEAGAVSVSYIIIAYTEALITWEDYYAQTVADNITWAEEGANIISNNITWAAEISPAGESGDREIIPNRPPIISGQDEDLGSRMRGFDVVFSVTDPDPNNTVDVAVLLDDTVTLDQPNAQQGVDYTVSVTDNQIYSMEDGSQHTITITATDNKGASSVRIYTFTAVEDLISTAVYYVLRDGVPVAKITQNIINPVDLAWQDYMTAGTHTYVIRAVDKYDNFIDSNPITITTEIDYATVARADRPAEMVDLKLRRNEPPVISRVYGISGDLSALSGRKYPVYTDSGNRTDAWSLRFTHRSIDEYDQLLELIDAGLPIVYRDCYDNVIIGRMPIMEHEFVRRGRRMPASGVSINFATTLERVDYTEAVDYD